MSLQVLHPLTDVLAHGQKPGLFQSPAPLPQDVQQTAVLHELSHDQQGALLQANTIQLHQLRVAQPPERDTVSLLCDDNKGVDKIHPAPPPPYIITLASSMKSSSYMAASLMALMATFCSALHLPSLTRPNWPLPSSFMKVSSLGLISHLSTGGGVNRQKGGSEEGEWKNKMKGDLEQTGERGTQAVPSQSPFLFRMF